MNTTKYMMIAGAVLLLAQPFVTVQPSIASINEENVNTYAQPVDYEQELQIQEELERVGEDINGENEQLFEDEQDF